MAIKNLVIRGGADFSGIKNEMNRTQKQLSNFQSKIGSTMKKVGVALGAAAIGKFVKDSIKMGSDVAEIQNVVETVFGSMTKDIEEFSKNSIRDLGMGELATKRYASTMGSMLKSSGVSGEAMKDMSLNLTSLTGDMASFFNLEPDEMFTKLMSGMSGMTMPLKELGINMNVANLEAYGMAQGIKVAYSDMNQADKTMLRYNYLLSVTGDMQGDFSKNSHTWANSVKVLGEQWKELKVAIGQGFINILQSIVGGLNFVVQKLQMAANYFRAFTEAIFGNTQGSKKSTKAMNYAAQSMTNAGGGLDGLGKGYGKLGKASKKAEKDMKGSLASFDEINTLSKNSGTDDVDMGSGGLGDAMDDGTMTMPAMEVPPLDATKLNGSMVDLAKGVKDWFKSIDFGPLAKSFGKLKESITPAIEEIGKRIGWFVTEILGPLASWVISDVLPVFLDLLSGALDVLNPIIEIFNGIVRWLWENFFIPLASWTGGIAVDVLGALADVLTVVGDWISGHKTLIEDMVIVIASFAGAWALVNVAYKAWNIAVGIWNSVGTIATGVTTAFNAAMAFLTSPITLVVLAIGAVIAIVVLLIKHWDKVKEFAGKCWEGIKSVWNGVANWFDTKVLTPLGNFFSDLWRGIKNGVIDAMNFCIRAINGLMRGILAPFNLIIKGVNMVPGINIPQLSLAIPQIPKLAKGGIIDSPTLAMVGEAGKEAVIPLENNTQGIDLLANKLEQRMGGGIKNDRPIEITLELGGGQFARFMIDSINNLQLKEGRTLLKI